MNLDSGLDIMSGMNTLGSMLSWENNPLHDVNKFRYSSGCITPLRCELFVCNNTIFLVLFMTYCLKLDVMVEMSCAMSRATDMNSPFCSEIGSETDGPEMSLNPNDLTAIHDNAKLAMLSSWEGLSLTPLSVTVTLAH